jgi:hypothetical protein
MYTMKIICLTFLAVSILAPAVTADDHDIAYKTAKMLNPMSQDDENADFKSMEGVIIKFDSFPTSTQLPAELLKRMRDQCRKLHPTDISSRLSALRNQIEGHYYLNTDLWCPDLPKDAITKIKAVSAMLWDGDYSAQYKYAISEANAYRRLQKISFSKTAAVKKYPNSYKSQLFEVMGIRPR